MPSHTLAIISVSAQNRLVDCLALGAVVYGNRGVPPNQQSRTSKQQNRRSQYGNPQDFEWLAGQHLSTAILHVLHTDQMPVSPIGFRIDAGVAFAQK
jgi:hypothetical protein